MFCHACGSNVQLAGKFCSSWGQCSKNGGGPSKNNKTPGTSTTTATGPKYLTFKQYPARKKDERATPIRKGTKSKDKDPFALINIGLMKYVGVDEATPVRGKSLPLKVKKDASYADVFLEALTKRQAHDKSFDANVGWKLVYPDGQLCLTLPGSSEEEFPIRKYKDDVGKPFNRITLYLCPEEPATSTEKHNHNADVKSEPNSRYIYSNILILSHA